MMRQAVPLFALDAFDRCFSIEAQVAGDSLKTAQIMAG